MLNTSQNFIPWKIYFDNPKDNKLGLMNSSYQIGSVASMPLVYVSCRALL